jgi:protein-tyrosine phosphatase
VIEIHAHVLPGIDDGPKDLAESLDLIRAFIADGVTHVVATPHVHAAFFPNTRSTNQAALNDFRQALLEHQLDIGLSVAGEVRLSEQVLELFYQNELPFLGEHQGMRSLLLEMPDGHIPLGAEKLFSWLLQRGVQPVIAHPERNRAVRDNPALAMELTQQGCKLQLTAGALLGSFGERVQAAAEFMLAHQLVSAIASDAHNLSVRAPCMAAAAAWITEKYSAELAHELTVAGPARLCGIEWTSSTNH